MASPGFDACADEVTTVVVAATVVECVSLSEVELETTCESSSEAVEAMAPAETGVDEHQSSGQQNTVTDVEARSDRVVEGEAVVNHSVVGEAEDEQEPAAQAETTDIVQPMDVDSGQDSQVVAEDGSGRAEPVEQPTTNFPSEAPQTPVEIADSSNAPSLMEATLDSDRIAQNDAASEAGLLAKGQVSLKQEPLPMELDPPDAHLHNIQRADISLQHSLTSSSAQRQMQPTPPVKPTYIFNAPASDSSSNATSNNTHAMANASLLALAPSVPTIRMTKDVYLALLNTTPPTLTAPSCCPPQATYTHYLLVGTREIVQDHKLILDVQELVPFGSSDASLLHAFVSTLSGEGGTTVLGWAAATRFDSIPLPSHPTAQQPLLDMASASIATSYFDLFHSAALTVLSRNCEPLKLDSGLQNLSRFCVEACAFLQDCVGIVCLNRSVLLGNNLILPFDTPELMPYDIERRLAVIAPHLFAAIDLKLSTPAAAAPAPLLPVSSSGGGTGASDWLVDPKESAYTGTLLPTNLPNLIRVHQVPHSAVHVVQEDAAVASFLCDVFNGDLGTRVLQNCEGGLSENATTMKETERAELVKRFEDLRAKLLEEFERDMVVYEREFAEVEALVDVYDVLKNLGTEDLKAFV